MDEIARGPNLVNLARRAPEPELDRGVRSLLRKVEMEAPVGKQTQKG